MPRKARKQAESGIYHVMLRGIDRQQIFEDSVTVLRYIHQNPVKAKLCAHVGNYPYSSYAEYLHESTTIDALIATQLLNFKTWKKKRKSDS